MDKKNVLLVTETSTLDFGAKSLGGVDSVCQDLIKSLVERESGEYNYRVLAFDPASTCKYTGIAQQLSENVSVVVAPCNEKLGGIRMPGVITQLFRVRQQITDTRPDIVHVHNVTWMIGVSSSCHRIATLHGYRNIGRKSVSVANDFFYVNIVPRLAEYFVDQFTCVGSIIKSSLEKDTNKPVTVIRNPINNIFFSCQHLEADGPVRFVTCSNLNPRKRLDRVLLLMHSLKQKDIDVQLNIIGSSDDERFIGLIRRQVEDLGLLKQVVFSGRKSPKQIAAIYQDSDFGVFLSEEETFGLAPLEMLAAGLPTIATCVGLLEEEREIFDGNGVFYYEENMDVDMLIAFLKSRGKQVKKIPAAWIMQKFSAENIVNAYESLYR